MVFHAEAFQQALEMVFQFSVFYWLTIGVIVGVGVGAIPGLTAATGVAIMLPLTFVMNTAPALALLIGLYKGAVFGGSISAISFATPGTPEAAATVYDGEKMMKAGLGQKAMDTALYSSVTADLASDLLTICIAPILAIVALKFGPSEKFWLVVLAFTLLGSLSGDHPAKGWFSAGLGVFFGVIGSDPVSFVSRMTFGQWWLQGGIPFIPLMIGIFAVSRMLEEGVTLLREKEVTKKVKIKFSSIFSKSGPHLNFREFVSCWKFIAIGFVVGSFCGMLPGLGSTVGAFLSFGVARRMFPEKKLGTGVKEGIAAAESGNNATVGPTLIPLLAFGIPGSATAALIGGALIIQGATPSPRMFSLFPHVVYALFIILIIGNFINLGIGKFFARLYAMLGQLPREILVPLILIMAIIGSYVYQGNPYDVLVMLIMGFLGYWLRSVGIPDAPLVITFLITPMMESSLRRALIIARGNWLEALFPGSLSISLAIAALVLTYLAIKVAPSRLAKETQKEATT